MHRSLALSLVVVLAILGSCRREERPGGAPEDATTATPTSAPVPNKVRLTLGATSEPETLFPLFTTTAVAREISFFMHRELTMLNDRWELVPDLAESIPTLENGAVVLEGPEGGPQKMVVTWKIRDDARWDDGTPITGDDFVFAWRVQLDTSQEVVNRDLPERIEKMEVKGPDRKILVVTWKEPYAFHTQFRVHRALPSHVLSSRYALPTGGTADLKRDPYGRQPMSSGPFRFKEWVPGQYIVLERNQLYRERANIDEIVIRFIPESTAAESALLAGDIDGMLPSGGLSVAQLDGLKSREGDRFIYYVVPGLVWAHIDFNLDDKWLKDVKLRQAIAHGINRLGIIDALYNGQFTLAHTYLPPRHWGYDPGVRAYDFNPALAEELLDKAGWKRRGKGKEGWRYKGSQKLRLELSAAAGIKDIEQLGQLIQADLKKIGVDVRLDNRPASLLLGEYARHRKFPHMVFYSWVMDPTSFGNTLWQSDMIPTKKNSWQGQNYPGWRDERVTALLREVPTTLDEEKRKALLFEVQDRWAEALPSLPMYFRPVVAVTTPKLKGFLPTGTQTPVGWNAASWELVE